ncbi:hypothetical protein GEV33_003793 [Tenebrio molitor]|uniref:Uncharacterized protein n=1 Tax=Tenebrio molitor TaxID=7067 RepID=A0A8J6HRM9_TENMO|nr:hypothetical protein GEV33_003793 [Tenebrio molitor]
MAAFISCRRVASDTKHSLRNSRQNSILYRQRWQITLGRPSPYDICNKQTTFSK